MDEKVLRDWVAQTTAQTLAIRDVVARLLAHEILRASDPDALLENFSDATAMRIFGSEKIFGEKIPTEVLDLTARMQAEVDWMIQAARGIAAGGTEA